MTTNEIFKKYTDLETFSRIIEFETVTQMWKNCLEKYPDLNAICYDGIHYTFSQIENDAAKFRSLLKKEDVQDGERVGLPIPMIS